MGKFERRPKWHSVARAATFGLFLWGGYNLSNWNFEDYIPRAENPVIIKERNEEKQTEAIPIYLLAALHFLGKQKRRGLKENKLPLRDRTEPGRLESLIYRDHYQLAALSLPSILLEGTYAGTEGIIPLLLTKLAPFVYVSTVMDEFDKYKGSINTLFKRSNEQIETGESVLDVYCYEDSDYFRTAAEEALEKEDYVSMLLNIDKSLESAKHDNPFSAIGWKDYMAPEIVRIVNGLRLLKEDVPKVRIKKQAQDMLTRVILGQDEKVKDSLYKLFDLVKDEGEHTAEFMLMGRRILESLGYEKEAKEVMEESVKHALDDDERILIELGENQHPVMMIANNRYYDKTVVIKGFTLLKYKGEVQMAHAINKERIATEQGRRCAPEFLYPVHFGKPIPFNTRQIGGGLWLASEYAHGRTVEEIVAEMKLNGEDYQPVLDDLVGDTAVMHRRLPVEGVTDLGATLRRWKLFTDIEECQLAESLAPLVEIQAQYPDVAKIDCHRRNAGVQTGGCRIWYELASIFDTTKPYMDLGIIDIISRGEAYNPERRVNVYNRHNPIDLENQVLGAITGFILRTIQVAGAWSMPGRRRNVVEILQKADHARSMIAEDHRKHYWPNRKAYNGLERHLNETIASLESNNAGREV